MRKSRNKPSSSPPTSVTAKKVSIDINRRLCKRCGICVHFCFHRVFELDENLFPKIINLEACTGCKLCELHCPDFAISVEIEDEVPIGQ